MVNGFPLTSVLYISSSRVNLESRAVHLRVNGRVRVGIRIVGVDELLGLREELRQDHRHAELLHVLSGHKGQGGVCDDHIHGLRHLKHHGVSADVDGALVVGAHPLRGSRPGTRNRSSPHRPRP